jgi:hypothetical protein
MAQPAMPDTGYNIFFFAAAGSPPDTRYLRLISLLCLSIRNQPVWSAFLFKECSNL